MPGGSSTTFFLVFQISSSPFFFPCSARHFFHGQQDKPDPVSSYVGAPTTHRTSCWDLWHHLIVVGRRTVQSPTPNLGLAQGAGSLVCQLTSMVCSRVSFSLFGSAVSTWSSLFSCCFSGCEFTFSLYGCSPSVRAFLTVSTFWFPLLISFFQCSECRVHVVGFWVLVQVSGLIFFCFACVVLEYCAWFMVYCSAVKRQGPGLRI